MSEEIAEYLERQGCVNVQAMESDVYYFELYGQKYVEQFLTRNEASFFLNEVEEAVASQMDFNNF